MEHVLIPPAPFSGKPKKGVQDSDRIGFPLFALAERGIKGVSACISYFYLI